ncbi:hypothetical protein INT45_004719 [Circinella minor]|uniref:Uncharacterized protein n=1 Tax=Circinella minor TaxID=1195481 RepID=A0A8H7VQJ4_9FUNG|nr:hypothetical protein INT45_004719 [Circinella minor]
MNGTLDLSDNSKNSQLSKFSVEVQKEIKYLFPPPTVTTPPIDQKYAEIQQKIQHTSNDNGRYYKRYLEKLDMFKTGAIIFGYFHFRGQVLKNPNKEGLLPKNLVHPFKTKEKYGTTKKLYVIILELMLYDDYIFDQKTSKLLSEADYVVKVWGGPLFETLFRGSGTILHWGDTVAENIKATGHNIKIDLRIISCLDNEKMAPNFATGEVAKDIWISKFYKDKLKTVLSRKMDLNQFIVRKLSKII